MARTVLSQFRTSATKPSGALRPAKDSDVGDLANWLNSGGDSRLRLRPDNHLSDYGCQPFPRPEVLSFASSTASTISPRAFAAVEHAARQLRPKDQFADLVPFVEALRTKLKALWGLGEETDVVFAPSGTDAVLRALYLAKCVLKPPTVSVVVAADESGSGVPLAAAGRHFNAETAYGFGVVKGEPIHGLASDRDVRLIATRGTDGHARPQQEIDATVFAATKAAVAEGYSVILLVMDHSKLGVRAPSPECASRIAGRWGSRVQIIVDACQARVSRARIQSELAQDRIVLLTGSKFFTGPTFSGAVFVPAALVERADAGTDIPLGFLQYTCASDWPARSQHLRSLLPPIVNLGQSLRWAAAIEEMQAYFSVPEEFRQLALAEFAARVSEYFREQPNFRLIDEQASSSFDADDEFPVPTIFSFLPMHDGRPCSMREAKLLYRALNENVSDVVRTHLPNERRLLAQACHIGQPVAIPIAPSQTAGSLRVSADARLISQSWFSGDQKSATAHLRANIDKLRIVFDKLQLLLAHLDALQRV